MPQRIIGQSLQQRRVFQKCRPLECADADMGMAQAHHGGAPCRGRLVIALQRFARLDNGERARRIDAQGLQHFRRQNLAHAALQRQPPVAKPAMGGLSRSLGPKVHQAALAVAQLGKQEPAAITDVGIIMAELVAMIAQRQRLWQAACQRRKAAEMGDPGIISQPIEPNISRSTVIAIAQDRLWEIGGGHWIGDVGHQRVDFGRGTIIGGLRRLAHAAIWGCQGGRIKFDRLYGWILVVTRRAAAPLSGLYQARRR